MKGERKRKEERKKERKKAYIQRQRFTRIGPLIPVNPHQRLAPLKKSRLQANDDKLHPGPRVVANVSRDLGHIGVVEGGVDLVEDEEWGRLVAVDGEEESERGHGFFAAGEVFHVAEALEGRHGVVFDAVEVGLVAIFHVEVARKG